MLPSPPGIRITLARGALGLIRTAREPPMVTVSSARARPDDRPKRATAAAKQRIDPYLVTSFSLLRDSAEFELRTQPSEERWIHGAGSCPPSHSSSCLRRRPSSPR